MYNHTTNNWQKRASDASWTPAIPRPGPILQDWLERLVRGASRYQRWCALTSLFYNFRVDLGTRMMRRRNLFTDWASL